MPLPLIETASELGRLELCLGSVVLQRAKSVNEHSGYGTRGHLFLQRINQLGGVTKAMAELANDNERELFGALVLDGMPLDPAAYTPEVALAWNPDTSEARVLGSGLDRDYRKRLPRELCGTVDILALVDDDAVFVADWKFLYGYVPPPRDNLQLLFGAVAAARAFNRSRAIIEIIRPREEGPPWRSRFELDAFALSDAEERLGALVARIDQARETRRVQLTEGPHCKYCPSALFCDAQTVLPAAIMRIAPAIPIGEKDPLLMLLDRKGATLWKEAAVAEAIKLEKGLTDEQELRLYALVKALKFMTPRLEKVLEARASVKPIRLPNGRVYGEREKRERSLDGLKAWQVIAARFGKALADKMVKFTMPLKQIEKLAKAEAQKRTDQDPNGKRVTIKAVSAELERELAQAGALKIFSYPKIKEFTPGKEDEDVDDD